jgi:tetrahydromethanopterin S-methyltransferase subunit H
MAAPGTPMMFSFEKAQTVAEFGGVKFGGQPGENPPLLVGSMFQKGDKLLDSRKAGAFDRAKATEYVKTMERLSAETGIPAMVALVANTADEMKAYVDFWTSVTDMPFALDLWVLGPRLESVEYVSSLGLIDRLLYEAVTPWSEDPEGEVDALADLGVKNILLAAFDDQDQTAQGRLSALRALLARVERLKASNVLVDTSVMNLPAMPFALWANQLVKQHTGLPAGLSAANGVYMWKNARELWGREGFVGIDAGVHAVATVLWSDFIFFGPMSGMERIFPAVAAASTLTAMLAYQETKALPDDPDHPLYRFFADFAEGLGR